MGMMTTKPPRLTMMRDFIFISVPKTGTKSIHAALQTGRTWHHIPASETRAAVDNWEAYFTFGFVRNPFDRLVSWYFFQKQDGSHRLYDAFESFEHWVKAGCPEHWTATGGPNPLLQYPFFMADDTIIVDFIGRYERLEEDFWYVCQQIGRPTLRLPHINPSRHAPYHTYYDAEMIDIVRTRFARDLALFEY